MVSCWGFRLFVKINQECKEIGGMTALGTTKSLLARNKIKRFSSGQTGKLQCLKCTSFFPKHFRVCLITSDCCIWRNGCSVELQSTLGATMGGITSFFSEWCEAIFSDIKANVSPGKRVRYVCLLTGRNPLNYFCSHQEQLCLQWSVQYLWMFWSVH